MTRNNSGRALVVRILILLQAVRFGTAAQRAYAIAELKAIDLEHGHV